MDGIKMGNGSVVISIEEYDELREIKENAGKIQVHFKEEYIARGLVAWLPENPIEDGDKIYIGKDDALALISDEAQKRIHEKNEQLERMERSFSLYVDIKYDFKKRLKFLFTREV